MNRLNEVLSKEFLDALIGSAFLVSFIGAVYFINEISIFIKGIFQ
jgi:hypothetical protein